MDIGVCLQSCYGCHEGGIQDDNSQNNSIPVPKGYRAKNCPSCKYFLTGPAFIFGMQALQNEILIASEDAVEKMDEFLLRKQEVEGSIYEFRVAHPGQNTPTELTLLLNKHQMAYLLEAEKVDIYASDITKLETLVRQSTAILNSENTQDGYQLIANDFKHIERSIEDCSNLRLYYEGLKNGIIYASIDASKAVDKSTDIISNIADNNGLTPKFYKLDKNQKLKSAKQFMDLLLVATDFSWERIENIVDGNLYLSDLNENEKVESIKFELQNLLDGKTSLLQNKTGKI
ncbi:MAG: hypothetical protein P8I03_07295 [Thalassotalea sp.]|nr:hypothetical protein [Thalassotalea sp.]